MSAVLCAGSETLHTRHPVLKSAGFEVLVATTEEVLLAAGRLPYVNAMVRDSRSSIVDLPAVATELKKVQPLLPVVLVTDAGLDDVPQPAVGFDRVISRLDGPTALLATLRELTADVVCISDTTTSSARANRRHTRQLRQGMVQLRVKLRQLHDKFSTTVHLLRKS